MITDLNLRQIIGLIYSAILTVLLAVAFRFVLHADSEQMVKMLLVVLVIL